MRRVLAWLVALVVAQAAWATELATRGILPVPAPPGAAVRPFVDIDSAVVVLRDVLLIDGTGAPATPHRTIILEHGQIAAIGGPELGIPAGARILDLHDHTVLPGLVGMHNHLFYIARPNYAADGTSEPPLLVPQMSFSAPRLYLAAGVTTIRTAGSVEPYADLNLKKLIDAGTIAGPNMDVTTPYLEGKGTRFVQMHELEGATEAREFVRYWAARGATSVKAYANLTRAELKAAIDEAHRLGLKVTGHLCAVTYAEAAELGIDNIEHGFFLDTANDPAKKPDLCPPTFGFPTLDGRDPEGADARGLIKLLVDRHVAITSTLAVMEQITPGRPLPPPAALSMLTPASRDAFLLAHRNVSRVSAASPQAGSRLARGMALERSFVAAGGLLMSGPDPTGIGGVLPGFGDVRGVELLVEAGFSPEAAIRIATLNGATYLGLDDAIGSVAVGKRADLIVVEGNAAARIGALEAVKIVFKNGIGYDPERLRRSVAGSFGRY